MLLKQNEKPLTKLVVNTAVSNSACAKVDASLLDPQQPAHQSVVNLEAVNSDQVQVYQILNRSEKI